MYFYLELYFDLIYFINPPGENVCHSSTKIQIYNL